MDFTATIQQQLDDPGCIVVLWSKVGAAFQRVSVANKPDVQTARSPEPLTVAMSSRPWRN